LDNCAKEKEGRVELMSPQRVSPDVNSKGGPKGQPPDPSRPYAEAVRQADDHTAAAGPAPEVVDDATPPLSEADQRHLLEYQQKIQLVRDRVVGVIRARDTGLYVWGPGGTGKSHAVISTLREFQANYRLHNSRMDGRGLFTAMERDPTPSTSSKTASR
jgi:hypothetical protein